MNWLTNIALASWDTLLTAAPWLLAGLAVAGFLNRLLSQGLVQKWLGGRGVGSIFRAALFGVPLPVCSCGVVPLAIEMHRKGASKPAALSFLITTPESGVESIALTYGLLGPVMAVARPIASLFTAVTTGVMALWFDTEAESPAADADSVKSCCASHKDGDAHAASAPAQLESLGFMGTIRESLAYGFGKLLNDISFWMVIGFVLTGIIAVLFPDDLSELGLGSGVVPMLIALAASVPMYICASASTPVAAMLIAKGLGPGAALVFLLAGPATNAASLMVLSKTFGSRAIRIYLFGIISGSFVSGLLLEGSLNWLSIDLSPVVSGAHQHGHTWLEWSCGIVLAILLSWHLLRGAFVQGARELLGSLAPLLGRTTS